MRLRPGRSGSSAYRPVEARYSGHGNYYASPSTRRGATLVLFPPPLVCLSHPPCTPLSLFSNVSVTRNRLFPLAFLPLSASGQSRNHATSHSTFPSLFPPSRTLRPHHAHTHTLTHLLLPSPTTHLRNSFPSCNPGKFVFSSLFSLAGLFATSRLFVFVLYSTCLPNPHRLCTLRHARQARKRSEGQSLLNHRPPILATILLDDDDADTTVTEDKLRTSFPGAGLAILEHTSEVLYISLPPSDDTLRHVHSKQGFTQPAFAATTTVFEERRFHPFFWQTICHFLFRLQNILYAIICGYKHLSQEPPFGF